MKPCPMSEEALDFVEVSSEDIPMKLMLEADPSQQHIRSYLHRARCFAARDGDKVVGVCIADKLNDSTCEIVNIAVYPEQQGRGIGSKLLRYALAELRARGVKRVELGTGTFGYQLTFYQRAGFRVCSVIKDHFLTRYTNPIFEHGIQHKDQLRLYKDLA